MTGKQLAVREGPLQSPERLYRALSRQTRDRLELIAGARDEDVFDLLAELVDTTEQRRGTVVVDWSVMFPTTGNVAGIARETFQVDLTRTPREAAADRDAVFEVRGTVGLAQFGVDPQPFRVNVPLAAFDRADTVRVAAGPLMVRADQPTIVINLPQQPPAQVVVNVPEQAPRDVTFERDRKGRLAGAHVG